MNRIILLIISIAYSCNDGYRNNKSIDFQENSLQAYQNWPKELCGKSVDSTLLKSLARSGLIALKITNYSYDTIHLNLNGGPLCDSIYMLSPIAIKSFVDKNGVDSLEGISSPTYFNNSPRKLIPKGESFIVLLDGKPSLYKYSKTDFYYSIKIDSANIEKDYELRITKTNRNEISIDFKDLD